MEYRHYLEELSTSGLFSEEVSEKIEDLLKNSEADEEYLQREAEKLLASELIARSMETQASVAQQISSVLNHMQIRVPFTHQDGSPGVISRWHPGMEPKVLARGLSYLAIECRLQKAEAERLRSTLEGVTKALRELPKPEKPPPETKPPPDLHPLDAPNRFVLQSIKSGRFIGLKDPNKAATLPNFTTLHGLDKAHRFTKTEATVQRADMRVNPKAKELVPGRKNYELFEIILKRID